MRQPGSPIKWPLPSAGVLLLTIGVVIFGDVALATQITGEYRWWCMD